MKYSILIGRFQPFHLGHYALLQEALNYSDKTILIFGSCNKPCSLKNPWNAGERQTMVDLSLKISEILKIDSVYMNDYSSDDAWLQAMRTEIYKITKDSQDITLVGHAHDSSSYYLNLFPEWKLKVIPNFDQFPHATKIRELYFSNNEEYKNYLHPNVVNYLENFDKSKLILNHV